MRAISIALALAAPLTICMTAPAVAADEYNTSTGITAEGSVLGVHGVDTVVLSTMNAVVRGDASHAVTHDGVTYYFASAISAERFQADPDRYLPQFGGFCAYAVANGRKFDGDPRYADIVDGRLYLFVNAAVFEIYLADRENILGMAHERWPSIQHSSVEDL